MPLSLSQFERQIADRKLAPVYLIAGSEDLLRIEASDQLRAMARELGFSEREVFDVVAGFDWNSLAMSGASMSLFASRRLIELRLPTGKPGKEGAAEIERWCKDPPPDTCLLIVANDWSRAHEAGWSRAVDKAGVFLQIWPLKPNEFPGWLQRRLRAAKLNVDVDAVALLGERVEGNLLAASQEIEKLAMLCGSERISAERMLALVADSARFNVFALTEAAMAGDAERALRMLRGLRAEGEQVVPLMNWVAGQVQILAHAAQVLDAGGNVASVWQQSRVWESRQAAYRKTVQRLGPAGAARLLQACAQLDLASKGRDDEDPWRLLERILLAIAKPQALKLLQPAP